MTLCFTSCVKNERLEHALIQAGDNRAELDSVLLHYKNDDLKYKAACFLVENMLGHARYDTSYVRYLQPVYAKCTEISKKHNWERNSAWQAETKKYWNKIKYSVDLPISGKKQDIRTLKADWLIEEIDLAFRAWKGNAYSKDIDFIDFCRYLLPYRIHDNMCIDNSRSVFYDRHSGWFSKNEIDFRQRVDSLLYEYKELMHNNFTTVSLPILNVATFEEVKRGVCDDRCRFNVLLFSSLGMPVVHDFVPAWGNRDSGHSWNAVALGDKTYPFEAFWDSDRWKYKHIYNNEVSDSLWGKFRLPKVYRHTYELHLEGALADKKVNSSDIPPLFRNPWIMDVSEQYFNATDVELELPAKAAEDYCYLCVFGHKGWIPVQWGKIRKNGKVNFPKMGRDIFYLPAYYRNGKIIPAGDLFLLDKQGKRITFTCGVDKTEIISRSVKYYFDLRDIENTRRWLSGARLMGCRTPEDNGELIYSWDNNMDMWNNRVAVSPSHSYRYYRLVPESDSIALCELSFYEGLQQRLAVSAVSGRANSSIKGEDLSMLTDGFSATGFKGNLYRGELGILFDLGDIHRLSSLSFTPYSVCKVKEGKEYLLSIWRDGWIPLKKNKVVNGCARFKDIPSNGVYRITYPGWADRIFIYRKGEIVWY